MQRIDCVFGIAVAILALAFVSFGVPTISDEWRQSGTTRYFTMGPRFYPYVAGWLCVVFGALMAVRPQAGLPDMIDIRSDARWRVPALMAIAFGYVVLMQVLGFVLASAAMLAVALATFGVRRWYVILPVVVVAPLAIKLLFLRVFALVLPGGMFELPWVLG
ncbi:MAG: tripartite tricarboxylate transporter TctB family protein [Acetobacterales bacterium]